MANDDDGILAPGSTLGRYTLVRRIAGGSMGQVYEARHADLDKRVAVKVMGRALGSSADLRERFLREGKAAARVRHPHAVDISDVGFDQNRLYLVMEYLEGEDLAALLKRETKLTPERTADLMLPVIAALASVHEEGIVHRDLKPANIFISRTRQGTIHPKVLDFGVSKMTQSGGLALTANADVLGTPVYMAPEQARASHAVDARADVYSIGGILYECVTGQRAFTGHVGQVFQRIATGSFPRPRDVAPEIPDGFEVLVLRAMAVRSEDRFATINELGCALLPFASPAARVLWSPVFAQAVSGDAMRDALDSLPQVPVPRASAPAALPVTQFQAMTTPAAEAALKSVSGPPPSGRRVLWIVVGVVSALVVGASIAMVVMTRTPPVTDGARRIHLRHAPVLVRDAGPAADVAIAADVPADVAGTPAPADVVTVSDAAPAPVDVAVEDETGHHHRHGHHHDDDAPADDTHHHHRHHGE